MSYKLKIIQENRFSRKLLVGRIRSLVSPSLYKILLWARYVSFPRKCADFETPTITYSDGSWVNRGTTRDLRNIQDFLLQQTGPLSVFQAGIGNSSLYSLLKDKMNRFVGVTIVQDEIEYAKQQFPDDVGTKYNAQLLNKYTDALLALGKDFDFIVDNDISSYACCRHHFHIMLDTDHDLIKENGAILIGFRGLGYFDSGFGLTEEGMRKIAAQHNMIFDQNDYCYLLKRKR